MEVPKRGAWGLQASPAPEISLQLDSGIEKTMLGRQGPAGLGG